MRGLDWLAGHAGACGRTCSGATRRAARTAAAPAAQSAAGAGTTRRAAAGALLQRVLGVEELAHALIMTAFPDCAVAPHAGLPSAAGVCSWTLVSRSARQALEGRTDMYRVFTITLSPVPGVLSRDRDRGGDDKDRKRESSAERRAKIADWNKARKDPE